MSLASIQQHIADTLGPLEASVLAGWAGYSDARDRAIEAVSVSLDYADAASVAAADEQRVADLALQRLFAPLRAWAAQQPRSVSIGAAGMSVTAGDLTAAIAAIEGIVTQRLASSSGLDTTLEPAVDAPQVVPLKRVTRIWSR